MGSGSGSNILISTVTYVPVSVALSAAISAGECSPGLVDLLKEPSSVRVTL